MFRHPTLFAAAVCLLLCPLAAWGQSWQFPLGEETTPDHFDLVFGLRAPLPWPSKAGLQLALCMRDEGNFYYADFTGGKVSLGSCAGGKRQALAGPAELPKPASQGEATLHEIAIQRRARLLQVVCDGLRVATAYDARLAGGQVAVAASEGLELEELTAQPIGDVYLFDDFTREPDESGAWDVLLGQWQSSGESIERPKPNLSANPFSYHVSAENKALVATGYEFWGDYRLRAAVKPATEGAVGLALYLTNPSNYYLLRWSRAGAEPQAGGRLQLVKVQAGSWSVLAEQVDLPYRIDQWHDLAIAAADGCLEAHVDGRLALSAHDMTFVRGRPALFAEDCASAYFDDVSVHAYERFAEDFSSPGLIGAHASEGRCCLMRGDWKIHHEHLYGAARTPAGHAYMLTGERTWSDYILDVMVKPKESRRVGLVFCYSKPSDHCLVRWGPAESGQGLRELVRVADGEEQVLATAHFAYNPTRFDKMRVMTHHGHLTVTVNGQLALEATDASFTHGQIGFYVEGDREACFDNVAVRFPEAPSPPPSITKQFTKEDTMATWASPEASWVKVSGGAFRYELPLFSDVSIDVHLKKLDREKGQLHLFLGADEQLGGGARLTASCEGGLLKAQLFAGDAELASGEARSTSSAPVLVVERHGGAVLASLADPATESILLAHQVPTAGKGNYVGFKRAGLSPAAAQIDVRSHGILDHAFSGAPTGWQPGAGIWEVYDRWPCARGWSWFGGRDQDSDPKNPILWCKGTWAGELVLQFWGAVIMDLDHEPGYSDPSDINCTICADGQNLCSGYSFIYAGDHNKKAKILRRDQVVAETDKGIFVNPISPNAEFHRHWFETRIHKVGGHIEYYVDNQLLLQYDDPNPLPDGHIALWSYNNGLLVSRVKISAEQRSPGA